MFQNAHIAAYGEIHMHTPPKVFPPSMGKMHTMGEKGKPRVYVDKGRDTQNIT